MLELHEEIRRARKELGLSQDALARLCGIQRRQLSILERGGNVTLYTLRKVLGFLPNLESFTFEQVRMKPTYIDHPPFEWQLFYVQMSDFSQVLEDVGAAVKEWLANPPKNVDGEIVAQKTETLATEIVKAYARIVKTRQADMREFRKKKSSVPSPESSEDEGGGTQD